MSIDVRLPVALLYRNAGVAKVTDDPEGEV